MKELLSYIMLPLTTFCLFGKNLQSHVKLRLHNSGTKSANNMTGIQPAQIGTFLWINRRETFRENDYHWRSSIHTPSGLQ